MSRLRLLLAARDPGLRRRVEALGHEVVGAAAAGDELAARALAARPEVVLAEADLAAGLGEVDAALVLLGAPRAPLEPAAWLPWPVDDALLAATLELAARRHVALARLRRSAAWTASILAHLPDAVVVASPGGHVTFLNAAGERLAGRRADEAVGRPLLELLDLRDDLDRPLLDRALDGALPRGATLGGAPIEGSAAPLRDEGGRGAGVVLSLRRPGAPAPEERLAPPLPGGAERIVLVEDEPAVRELVLAVLRGVGYTVHHAGPGGLEALARAADPVDLLVMDLVLPGADGLELAARWRALRPGARVLFVSGFAAPLRTAALGPGDDFLAKPFTPGALVRKVRELLDGGPQGPR